MSSGSLDLAYDFVNDFLIEDEISSLPTADAPGGGGLGFGDSSGVSPLSAILRWKERERLEALEAFLNDENKAQGMGVHAEETHKSALQPAYAQRSVGMWPNTRGQPAALARPDAPALPGSMIPFRRSVTHSPLKKPRRAPGRSISDAAPAPPAPGAGPRRRRPRVDVPKARGSVFERRPVGQTPDTNITIIVEDFQSMFRHPFDASITPVVYSLSRAPPIRSHCQTFSAPAIDSTALTTVRSQASHPVLEQDPLQSAAVDLQCDLPPISLEEMDFDQLSSTTIPAHDPCAQAERVLPGKNHGSEDQVIDISSSSASSDCSIPDMDQWGPIDTIDPPVADPAPEPAAPPAAPELPEAQTFRTPRLTWTPELISRFEAAIALLGGPDKATPKAICRCMACPQVTILNVKSRLQKFRLQVGTEADPSRGTKRSQASTASLEGIPEDTVLGMEFVLNQVYETCKDWTERLEVQNLHMRHVLALHHTQAEAAKHNAMVLEEYAASRLNNPKLKAIE